MIRYWFRTTYACAPDCSYLVAKLHLGAPNVGNPCLHLLLHAYPLDWASARMPLALLVSQRSVRLDPVDLLIALGP